jgi:oxygen-independent coproporphyrinogen-3 oxidase
MMTGALAVYLHIPFCRRKCAYCALPSRARHRDSLARYVPALAQEVRAWRAWPGRPAVESIYFGGGTPALLHPAGAAALLAACSDAFTLSGEVEVTLEAHPGAVSLLYLRDLRRLGINRLSIGVQSGHDETLARLGRRHTVAAAQRALTAAREAGFDNVGVDLIYGLPGESLAHWRDSLRRVLAWSPDHISMYALTVEDGTPLACWVRDGRAQIADDDLMADMYDLAGEMLDRAGLMQYELSNWARPGLACRHNLHVWRGGDYVGCGAGAHGLFDGVRYTVTSDVDRYIRRLRAPLPADDARLPSPAIDDSQRLTPREQMAEFMFLGLRLTAEGVSAARFEARFGRRMWDVFGAQMAMLIERGLLARCGDAVCLTPRARLVSNQVFMHFL